jgi:hypothetical protein
VAIGVVATGVVTVAVAIGVTTVTVAGTFTGSVGICGVDTTIVGTRITEVDGVVGVVEGRLTAGVESRLTACVNAGAAITCEPLLVVA